MSKLKANHLDFDVLAHWIESRLCAQPGRLFLLTLRFDQRRVLYVVTGSDHHASPTKADVAFGLTRQLPLADAKIMLWGDLDKFFRFLLRALFGKRYCKRLDLQPLGIGGLDSPVYKGVDKRSAAARRSTNVLDHAHFVISIPYAAYGDTCLVKRFERLVADGTCARLWRRLNCDGEFHCEPIERDLRKVLAYTLKTANKEPVPADDLRFWPASS